GNPALGQIVGRHLYHNSVSWQDTNEMKAHFPTDMGKDFVTALQLDPEHRVRQEFGHFALNFDRVFSRHVRISGSPLVTRTVCSKWAEGKRSTVTAVQPSASTWTPGLPILTMGSMARVMPAFNLGPLPRRP